MVTRIAYDEAEAADEAAEALYAAGLEVAVITERDPDEEPTWVVATPATPAEVTGVLGVAPERVVADGG